MADTPLATTSIFKTPTVGGFLGAAGDLFSGITTFRASKDLAADTRFQGEVFFNESVRTAKIIIEEGRKFAAGQSLQYIGSGVQLAGSALITIAQTIKFAKTEAAATFARGSATKALADKSAARIESQGRAALISGIIGGASRLFL